MDFKVSNSNVQPDIMAMVGSHPELLQKLNAGKPRGNRDLSSLKY